MDKHLLNLKFAVKELQQNSKMCDRKQKAETAKVKQAIQRGCMEAARIHAENAVCQKHQSTHFLRMSVRVDAMASRVQTAVTMNQISALMDKFENQFQTLDVQTAQTEDAMGSTTMLAPPQSEVNMLLREVADEAGLVVSLEFPEPGTSSIPLSVASAEQDELTQRLSALKDLAS